MKNIVVLISGNGSNLQAIIAAKLNLKIITVLSNNPDANGLNIAKKAGIKTEVIAAEDPSFLSTLQNLAPDLIVLAGFMKILNKEIVDAFHHKIINIHPSLLPAYPGLNTHERVLAGEDKFHGVTVHVVDEKCDHGPIIAQTKCRIQRHDTVEKLTKRIQTLEHRLYPCVLKYFAQDKLTIESNKIILDGQQLPSSGMHISF